MNNAEGMTSESVVKLPTLVARLVASLIAKDLPYHADSVRLLYDTIERQQKEIDELNYILEGLRK